MAATIIDDGSLSSKKRHCPNSSPARIQGQCHLCAVSHEQHHHPCLHPTPGPIIAKTEMRNHRTCLDFKPILHLLPRNSKPSDLAGPGNGTIKHYLYVHFDNFSLYGYMPGEWAFILNKQAPSSFRVISIVQLWPMTEDISPDVVWCEESFLPSIPVSTDARFILGTPVHLIPVRLRRTPPCPAHRVLLYSDSSDRCEATPRAATAVAQMQHNTQQALLQHAYLHPGGRILHIYPLADATLIPAIGKTYSGDESGALFRIVNEFPLYYPYAKTVFIWSDTRNLSLQNSPLSSFSLLCDDIRKKFPTLESNRLSELLQHASTIMHHHHPSMKSRLPWACPYFLLHGPSGSGKSFFCSMVTSWMRNSMEPVFVISWQETWLRSSCIGQESTSNRVSALLAEMFEQAKVRAPSIVLLDPLEDLFRLVYGAEALNPLHNAGMALLLSQCMKSISGCRVLTIATMSRLSNIPAPQWLLGQRIGASFCIDMAFPLPDLTSRITIMEQLLVELVEENGVVRSAIHSYARHMNGWTLRDLSGFCSLILAAKSQDASTQPSSMDAMVESFSKLLAISSEGAIEAGFKSSYQIIKSKIHSNTKRQYAGSENLASLVIDQQADNLPQWDDIGGQEHVKERLQEAVEWPLYHPERFCKMGITPTKGILLYGPPGNSKTLLAKALARKSACRFLAIKGPQLFNKWVGESEKALREVFHQARSVAPCILFLDEVDAIGGKRDGESSSSGVQDRLLTQLLIEMDGLDNLTGVSQKCPGVEKVSSVLPSVIIIAATNRPDILDPALIRPGRLDRLIYIPLPDTQTRRKILHIQRAKMKSCWEEGDGFMDRLVERTKGYSGAELVELCQISGMMAMEQDPVKASSIKESHFEMAFEKCAQTFPRTSASMIAYYEAFSKRHRVHI